jgi:hypothetical protein
MTNPREGGRAAGEAILVVHVTYHDPDHSLSEERFITVGMSRNGRVLIVAHSDRGENIRIISARLGVPPGGPVPELRYSSEGSVRL